MSEKCPHISIIIPAKNSQKTINACLDSLLNLDYENYDVIMIDDGSTDRTPDIIKEYCAKDVPVKLLFSAGEGPSAARNMGIEKSEGKYIAFTDADCIIDKNWLNELLKGFNGDTKTAAVGGVQLSPEDETSFGKTIHSFLGAVGFAADYMKAKKSRIKDTAHNPTCNVMYRKEALEEVSGFLNGLWPGEDVEIDYRIKKNGWSFKYNPGAVVQHYRPSNLRKFFKMMYHYGRAQGFLARRYGPYRKIHFVPLIFPVLAFLLVMSGSEILPILLVSGSVFIFLFLLAKANKKLDAFRYFLLFIVLIAAWNAGFIKEILFPGYKTEGK